MADSNQSSSGVGGVVGTAKADAAKAAGVVRAGVQNVEQAQVKAESWVEKHPLITMYAGICLGLAVILALIQLVKQHH